MIMKKLFIPILAACAMLSVGGCKQQKSQTGERETIDTIALAKTPVFSGDSAMRWVEAQCDFGPRVTGSQASQQCGDYLIKEFERLGLTVTEQKAELTRFDGQRLPMRNIIASLNPDNLDRLLICAHWDSRPWADQDADESKHHTPILGANDGASGVAVMLELARAIQQMPITTGIDFVCFDAEDMGAPEWAENDTVDTSDTWCLGSAYWAEQAYMNGYGARFGILLDMVGGKGTYFAKEGVSMYFARPVNDILWQLAKQLGYGDLFQDREGGQLIDDHVKVNTIARIPCIDIVPNVTTGISFGPTWHTTQDTPENIDPAVMKAVGQSVLQMIYNDAAMTAAGE